MRQQQHRLVVTVLDTPPASPVWRLYSERVGARRSYREIEDADVISSGGRTRARRTRSSSTTCSRASITARRLYAIDPRRTRSAQWADAWLGLDVGSDIALANAVGREIIAAGLENGSSSSTPRRASRRTRAAVEPYTLELGRAATPACRRERSASSPTPTPRPTGRRSVLDARDHRAPQRGRQRARADQPVAADRARGPLRLGPQPAAGAEQRPGRRRHGRDPEQAARLPGHRKIAESRPRFERDVGRPRSPPSTGWHLSQMFEAMERGEFRTLYVLGENPLQLRGRHATDRRWSCSRASIAWSCRTSS